MRLISSENSPHVKLGTTEDGSGLVLRLDCRWLRRVVVIEPTDGTAIRTRDQLAAGVDGDLDFSCPSCSLT